MYLSQVLKKYSDKKCILFVDMDGVIADFSVGDADHFLEKRPLLTSIQKLQKIATFPNIELHILSVCGKDKNIQEKNQWLDQYAPFFLSQNRHILSKESTKKHTMDLKKEFIASVFENSDKQIIIIDDDPNLLKEYDKMNLNLILLKDTVLID